MTTHKSITIHPFMRLNSSGELKLKADILDDIYNQLCHMEKSAKRDTFNIIGLKNNSKTVIKTDSNYFPDVFSVPKYAVEHWVKVLNLGSVAGLHSQMDLVKGEYEGGFKVWEATTDLVNFLTQDDAIVGHLLHRGTDLRFLELGAGAALPTLALLGRLIGDPIFESNYEFHIQDYNWQVLSSLTLMNFAVNLPHDYLKALIDNKCLRYFYGDWKHFRVRSNAKYDLIFMSEVIYDRDNYSSLHDLLDKHLESDGFAVIATKDTYFGLTGGLYSLIEYLDARRVLIPCKIIQVSTTNIPRSILILRRIE